MYMFSSSAVVLSGAFNESVVGCFFSILIGSSRKVITQTAFILLKVLTSFELSDLKAIYIWCLVTFIKISFIFEKLFLSK